MSSHQHLVPPPPGEDRVDRRAGDRNRFFRPEMGALAEKETDARFGQLPVTHQ